MIEIMAVIYGGMIVLTFINLLVLMMVIKMHTEVLKIRELTRER